MSFDRKQLLPLSSIIWSSHSYKSLLHLQSTLYFPGNQIPNKNHTFSHREGTGEVVEGHTRRGFPAFYRNVKKDKYVKF